MVIAAALSIQDPRERPADHQQAADDKHARFADEQSDFLAYLNLWNYLQEQQKALSSSRFRKLCREDFLHYLRVREWQDLVSQLRQVVKGLGITLNSVPAEPRNIHISLLAGLLSHVGVKATERHEYDGARGARFAIFPGSALARKQPRWVMAAELVETSRLWARDVARIEPEWAEPLAEHLVRRSYSEPHWEKKRAGVVAYEKVLLYGVPLVASRKVDYGRIDPVLSRELFIRHALVEGDWSTHHAFFAHNQELLEQAEELEHRVRRRDIVVGDDDLFAFYDARIPAAVVSGRHFDAWWKKVRRTDPDLLTLTPEQLIDPDADVSKGDYPDHWQQGDLTLPLTYQFEPGTDADGVTVHIPLPVLNRVTPDGFDWHVRGLREDLVTALIRSLPKSLRRNFVPAPDVARAVAEAIAPGRLSLLEAVRGELRRLTGVDVPPAAWDLQKVPAHLRMTFRVVDADGATLAEGKDLSRLKTEMHPQVRETLSALADSIEQDGLTDWTVGALPRTFEQVRGGQVVTGYPALVDCGDSVALRVLATPQEQQPAMWRGARRLLTMTVASPAKPVLDRLDRDTKLALGMTPYDGVPALFADCVAAAVDTVMADNGGTPWDADGFSALQSAVRRELPARVLQLVTLAARIQSAAREVDRALSGSASLPLLAALSDLRAQLGRLVYAGFVSGIGARRLPDVLRYLQGMLRRLETLPRNPERDRQRMEVVQRLEQECDALRGAVSPAALTEVRWMLEELRVSLFAQGLGTPYPVSEKRILRAIDDLTG